MNDPATPAAAQHFWQSDRGLLLTVTGLAFLTRLPFLGNGYGVDGDAWRLVRSGQTLWSSGDYHPSRLPGYPIPEAAIGLLAHGGPWLANGVTALLSALAVAFFALVMRRLGNRYAALAALAFALVPVVYVGSVQSMDYAWALAFAMAALYALVSERPLWAGVLLGLAGGCRVTSLSLLLPFATYLLWRPRAAGTGRALLRLIAPALLVFLAVYAVVLVSLGGDVLPTLTPTGRSWLDTLIRGTFGVWDVLGVLALAGALVATTVVALTRGAAAAYDGRGYGKVVTMSAVGVAVYALIYLRAPLDPSYLIPMVPFVLLLLARIPRQAFAALCVVLVASPFVFTLKDAPAGARFSRTVGLKGRIFVDRTRRAATLKSVKQTEAAGRRVAAPGLLVAGYYKPWLDVRDGGRVGELTVVMTITPAQLAAAQAAGMPVWYLPKVKDYVEHGSGVRLTAPAAQPLDLTAP